MYEAFSKLVTRVAGQLRVRSALNPILWLAAIVTLPILAQAVKDVNLPTWMIVLAYIPVATAAIGFLYLMIFNPDRLQTEDYQIRKQSLELVQQKGSSFEVAAASIEAIANPSRRLEGPGER